MAESLLLIIGAIVALFAVIGFLGVVYVGFAQLTRSKARRLALLSDSCNRLKVVVAELLEKVDRLDQSMKFGNQNDSSVQKGRLAVAATDLVTVTDCLPAIEQLIEEKRFNDAADLLSASCRVVQKVVKILGQVDQSDASIYSLPDVNGIKLKLPKKDSLS